VDTSKLDSVVWCFRRRLISTEVLYEEGKSVPGRGKRQRRVLCSFYLGAFNLSFSEPMVGGGHPRSLSLHHMWRRKFPDTTEASGKKRDFSQEVMWVLGTLYLFSFFLGGTGVWTQGLHLLGRHSLVWATPPALFTLIILEIGSCFLLRQAWTVILLFYISTFPEMTGVYHHTQLFSFEMGPHELLPSPLSPQAGLKLQSSNLSLPSS
jgi:hypothetical protein